VTTNQPLYHVCKKKCHQVNLIKHSVRQEVIDISKRPYSITSTCVELEFSEINGRSNFGYRISYVISCISAILELKVQYHLLGHQPRCSQVSIWKAHMIKNAYPTSQIKRPFPTYLDYPSKKKKKKKKCIECYDSSQRMMTTKSREFLHYKL
jgi:hypothetical protein